MYTVVLWSQARVDRQRFSSEGIYQSDGGGGVVLPPSQDNHSPVSESGEGGHGSSSLRRGLAPNPKFSHFACVESAEVLKAATTDLVRIFQLQVHSLRTACSLF